MNRIVNETFSSGRPRNNQTVPVYYKKKCVNGQSERYKRIVRLPDNTTSKGIWVDLDFYAVCALCFTDIEPS